MKMVTTSSLECFVPLPENKSAREAIFGLRDRRDDLPPNPLVYLHGSPGSGKSLLVRKLANELESSTVLLPAQDFPRETLEPTLENPFDLRSLRTCDTLIIEDLPYLSPRLQETLANLLDDRSGGVTVVTASVAPRDVKMRGESLNRRLASRLVAGLVVAIEPLGAKSRRQLLEHFARERDVHVPLELLDWLANHLTQGGRQLAAAISQIDTLRKLQSGPLSIGELQEHFRTQIDLQRPTVDRIVAHVGQFYRVAPKKIQAPSREREVLVPRQVSMYLARRLTTMSFHAIGCHFGGRDQSTVQHACRKIENALKTNLELSGIIRQMHAELA